MQKNSLRRRFFIDPDVQTGLLKRLGFYWVASLLFLTLPIAFAKTISDPSVFFLNHVADVYLTHWPVLVMLMFFLPFAMNDALKYSNRFAGPIYRLRCELKNFENGNRLKPIKFRNGDFWHDLALGVNRVTARLNELEDLNDPKSSEADRDEAEVTA